MAMNKVVVLLRDPEGDEGNSVTVGPFSSWGRAEAWIEEFGFNLPDSPLEALIFTLYGIRESSKVADQYGFSGSNR